MTTRSPFPHLFFNDGPSLHTTEVLEILARHEGPGRLRTTWIVVDGYTASIDSPLMQAEMSSRGIYRPPSPEPLRVLK